MKGQRDGEGTERGRGGDREGTGAETGRDGEGESGYSNRRLFSCYRGSVKQGVIPPTHKHTVQLCSKRLLEHSRAGKMNNRLSAKKKKFKRGIMV